jgi:ubiquinone/menaquinone biosynthesis C-methylase UbiE
MDPRLQRRVQRYGWDKASAYYEQYWRHQLRPAQRRLLDLAALRPGERVVDVACGTGLVTLPSLAAVTPDGAVIGTDISERMVQRAREVAQAEGHAHAEFVRMDAEALELPDESFDAALCGLGLMYVPDPLASVKEMYRVLRPGGRIALAVWGARHHCGWADIFPIVDARVESEVCPLFFQLGTGDGLRRTVEAAGFADVVEDRINTLLHYETAEDALGAAFAGGPVAMAYSRFDEQTREEAHADYLSSIEPYRNGQGYEIPGEFVIVRGEK